MNHQATKDLTHGNIYKQLITLSIPLIIGNILQQFYNTIDAFVVGRSAGLPTVAVATGIGWICANIFWGICYRLTRSSSHAA